MWGGRAAAPSVGCYGRAMKSSHLPALLAATLALAACGTAQEPTSDPAASPAPAPAAGQAHPSGGLTPGPPPTDGQPADEWLAVEASYERVVTVEDGVTIVTTSARTQEGKHGQQKLQTEGAAARDASQRPQEVMRLMGLEAGDVVADVGCGAGYFSFHFSDLVGPEGLVYCVDSDPNAVYYVKERILERGVDNIHLVYSAYAHTLLEPASSDFAFLCDVHLFARPGVVENQHYMDSLRGFYASIHAALRSDGKLVLLEATKEHANGRGVDEQQIVEQLAPFGFELIERHPITQRSQYFMVFGRGEGPVQPATVTPQESPASAAPAEVAPLNRTVEGNPARCPATAMSVETHGLAEGAGVKVTGTTTYEGRAGGALLIDAMAEATDGSMKGVYHTICNGLGPFELELPPDLGKVRLVAVIDHDYTGPGAGDPVGVSESIRVGIEPISGVEVPIVDDPPADSPGAMFR
jgi:SAM-dependent methyltransferase